MNDAKFQNYLIDLSHLVKEKSLMAKLKNRESNDPFDAGRLMALYEIVSLMQAQARAFDISLNDIAMADIDPESDLLGP